MRLVTPERLVDAKDNYETPWYVIRWLEAQLSLPCTLDVCAAPGTAKASVFFTEQDNGLEQSWETTGFAFCNPPLRDWSNWIKKAATLPAGHSPVALLIPPRTDTRNWHEYAPKASEIFFIKGRISFFLDGEVKRNNGTASCILIFNNAGWDTQYLHYVAKSYMETFTLRNNHTPGALLGNYCGSISVDC